MALFETGGGFSIELINNKLISRGKYKNLPLYESLGGQVTAIAFVKEPAIGEKAFGDDSDRKIMGPVMIPDLKIYRNTGPNGTESCYCIFQQILSKNYKELLKEK